MNPFSRLTLAAMLSVLVACASGPQIKEYAATGPINATAEVTANDERLLLSRYANLALFSEVALCEFEYAGSILIDENTTSFALPSNERILVQLNFIERDTFFQSFAHNSFDLLLSVKPASTYEFDLVHGQDGADYTVTETRFGNKRPAQLIPLADCN